MTEELLPDVKALRSKAHRAVRQELHMGRMVRPEECSQCGCKPPPAKDGRSQIHAHHHNGHHNKLDVVWLCVWCHREQTPVPAAERSGTAKITPEDAMRIFNSNAPTSRLASRYGVHVTSIRNIRRGKYWRSVTTGEANAQG